jgi:hypothetical protein
VTATAAVPGDAQPRHLPDERAAEDGVVDAYGRAHDVPNLFISDGSVFTTGAAANPTLTIVALAIRQAEHIVEQLRLGTSRPGVHGAVPALGDGAAVRQDPSTRSSPSSDQSVPGTSKLTICGVEARYGGSSR